MAKKKAKHADEKQDIALFKKLEAKKLGGKNAKRGSSDVNGIKMFAKKKADKKAPKRARK